MLSFRDIWNRYSLEERRNIAFYIGGMVFKKLGLEFFSGSITTLAADRFHAASTFSKLGAAQGVNQAAQCVGAILTAPLIKRWPTRSVLSGAIFFFGLMTAILLIADAATGGRMKPPGAKSPAYGDWNPNLIFLVWTLAGIAHGMVELIRRVIPVDIVGDDVGKLRRMDAVVYIFYEAAGTAGAFSSSSAISRWGNNYSFFLSPVFFAFAGAIWLFISTPNHKSSREDPGKQSSKEAKTPRKKWGNYFLQIVQGLFPSYAIALYCHRFLDSSLCSAFAKRVLGTSAWAQIIVGGSHFGELLGAVSVFFLSDIITTPLPWLRADALALNIIWVLPYYATVATKDVSWAWKIAGCLIPISYGWAAGDVSLGAYIQSVLSDNNSTHKNVSPLGAVMAFLYSTYIVLNAIFSSVLGKIIDNDFIANQNIKRSLIFVAGVHFSACSAVIFLSTFIPRGAFALNPKVIDKLDGSNVGDPIEVEDALRKKGDTESE